MSQSYFLITTTEDGIRIRQTTKEQVAKEMADGECEIADFAKEIPKDADPNYWGCKAVLIKGEIVVPREKTVVTEIEVP